MNLPGLFLLSTDSKRGPKMRSGWQVASPERAPSRMVLLLLLLLLLLWWLLIIVTIIITSNSNYY